MDIYYSCGGPSWQYANGTDPYRNISFPWGSGDPCNNSWFGVKCERIGNETHVVELFTNPRYSGNKMSGTLPDSIGNLTSLRQLYTSNDRTPSNLTGPIPATIGKLTGLQCLYLSHNKLMGPIPQELSLLVNLQGLYMRVNHLSGALPDLSNLTHLQDFWIDTNFPGVHGTLDFVNSMPYLHTLNVFINHFSGILPERTCSIHTCRAEFNNFTCPIPINPQTGKHCCEAFICHNTSRPHNFVSSTHLSLTATPTPPPKVCHTE